MTFDEDLAATLALNPGWGFLWDAAPAPGGEFVCRLQNLATREEVNGNGPTRDDALEILLVRMELSGRFDMPELPGI